MFLVSGWNVGFYHVCGGALLGFERSVVFVWLRFLCFSQGSPGCVGGFFGGVCFENFIVDASIFVDFVVVFWQATKCDRWMPWHQEPMKDVVTCDKPRGVGKRAVILGCPNGETLNFRSCVR